MFSTLYGTYISFQMHFKMSSTICFGLDQSKILSSGNWLIRVSIHQPFSRKFWHNFWLAKPYSLANQKLCYNEMPLNIKKKNL